MTHTALLVPLIHPHKYIYIYNIRTGGNGRDHFKCREMVRREARSGKDSRIWAGGDLKLTDNVFHVDLTYFH